MDEITQEQVEEILRALRERQTAYRTVFAKGNASDVVISDLKRFCKAEASTMRADARVHAFYEGQRSVWLRIAAYLEHTEEDLLAELLRDKAIVYRIEDENEEEDHG